MRDLIGQMKIKDKPKAKPSKSAPVKGIIIAFSFLTILLMFLRVPIGRHACMLKYKMFQSQVTGRKGLGHMPSFLVTPFCPDNRLQVLLRETSQKFSGHREYDLSNTRIDLGFDWLPVKFLDKKRLNLED